MNTIIENKYIRVRVPFEFWEAYKEKALEYQKNANLMGFPIEEIQSDLILIEAMSQLDGPCRSFWNIEEKITYEGAKEKIFAYGTIPDGENGERQEVGFFILNKKIMIHSPSGYFTSHFPSCKDEEEALNTMHNYVHYNGYIEDLKAKETL
jgi:hypothetical protein